MWGRSVKIFQVLIKMAIFLLMLIIGKNILDINRTIGTIILTGTVALPLWWTFLKNRIKKWWVLLPAWLVPIHVLLILKLEGTLNEIIATVVLLLVALPFSIIYITKTRHKINKLHGGIHSLMGIFLIIGLPILYLVALMLTPYSGIARNIAYGGAYVGDAKHFPYRIAENQAPVYTFKTLAKSETSDLSNNYLQIVKDFKLGEYESFEDFLKNSNTTSFLVIKDDTLLYEWYGNDYDEESLMTSFSVAKSFVSALIGFAIEDGAIRSVDDPITDYIPELLHRDSRFKDITIRHLLNMTSGIHYAKDGLPWGDDMLTYYAIDMRKSALSVEIERPPNEEFLYNNYNPLLLGLIIERTTGKNVTQYLEEKIWYPLGMEAPCTWSIDSEQSGFEKMQVGINARAIDYAKFGRLYLNKGNWNGKQLLSEKWVEESTHIDPDTAASDDYKYFWWINENRYCASGAYGQYIYIYPKENMIILRFGTKNDLGDVWETIFDRIVDSTE